MSKRSVIVSFTTLFFMLISQSVTARINSFDMRFGLSSMASADTDRGRDGLLGPVRRIRTETVKLVNKGGKTIEGQRQLLETAAYDLKGAKVENAYFPAAGAGLLTGRETYKYNDKGNISEMTFYNADGSLLGKEVYIYEYDFVGNWTKMTTSVAVIEAGDAGFEPTEITYRTISYFLDESLARLAQPLSSSALPTATVAATTLGTTVATKPATNSVSEPSKAKADTATATGSPKSDAISNDKSSSTGSSVSPSVPHGNSTDSPKKNDSVDIDTRATSAPKPLIRPVSGGVLNGKAVDLPTPVYPEIARRMQAKGVVAVEVVIDLDGKVISAKALSGNSLLHAAAVQAALRARFSPTTLSGQPVRVSGVINYNFALGK